MNKKIIAVDDYLKVNDRVVDFDLHDLENPNQMVTLALRIKRASPRDTIKIMELVNLRFGDNPNVIAEDDISKMSAEQRNATINLSYQYDATLISSCVYHPPANGNMSEETERVFEDMDAVLDRCPSELFERLREIIGRQKMVLPSAEAKK